MGIGKGCYSGCLEKNTYLLGFCWLGKGYGALGKVHDLHQNNCFPIEFPEKKAYLQVDLLEFRNIALKGFNFITVL